MGHTFIHFIYDKIWWPANSNWHGIISHEISLIYSYVPGSYSQTKEIAAVSRSAARWTVTSHRLSVSVDCKVWNSRSATISRQPLEWRHNERDGVSNHQSLDCLPNRFFGPDQRKHQISASLVFVRGIHRWPVNSPHKGPVSWKCFHLTTSSWIVLKYRLLCSTHCANSLQTGKL